MPGHAHVFGYTGDDEEELEEDTGAKAAGCTSVPYPCGPKEERHFACDGRAEIVVPHAGLRIRGSLLDLGCSGCFIHIPALNLERGTHVEVLLAARQMSVRVAGCISAIYPHLGVCIAFSGVSARTASLLEALVTELEQAKEGVTQPVPEKVETA